MNRVYILHPWKAVLSYSKDIDFENLRQNDLRVDLVIIMIPKRQTQRPVRVVDIDK